MNDYEAHRIPLKSITGEEYIDGLQEELIEKEKELKNLEEENELLRNEIAWLKEHTQYNGVRDEYYIDNTITAQEAKTRLSNAKYERMQVAKLEEENKKLKAQISDMECAIKDMQDELFHTPSF